MVRVHHRTPPPPRVGGVSGGGDGGGGRRSRRRINVRATTTILFLFLLAVLFLAWTMAVARFHNNNIILNNSRGSGTMEHSTQLPRPRTPPSSSKAKGNARDDDVDGDGDGVGGDGAVNATKNNNAPPPPPPPPDANNNASFFPEHYAIFSTGCSTSQDWQSLVLFHHAAKIRQPGKIVRIACGCNKRRRRELEKIHSDVISQLSPNFGVHFAPEYSNLGSGATGGGIDGGGDGKEKNKKKEKYHYFNKPFGVMHWLEHGPLGYKYHHEEDQGGGKRVLDDDAIIILLDPDNLLLRPLTYDFSNDDDAANHLIVRESKRGPPGDMKVSHGHPWAAPFAFGDGPWRLDLDYVFANYNNNSSVSSSSSSSSSSASSPALATPHEERVNNYMGGPPYLATAKDMRSIVTVWCDIVTRVHDAYDGGLLGEMFAWSLAAAHLELPHTLVESFAVANVFTPKGIEGWRHVDELADDDVCGYHRHPSSSSASSSEKKLPYVMHYCQNYVLGDWYASKYGVASQFFFSCEEPLLMDPPPRDIKAGGEAVMLLGKYKNRRIGPTEVKRERFAICLLTEAFNDAAAWYKGQTCDEGTANYDRTNAMFRWSGLGEPRNLTSGK